MKYKLSALVLFLITATSPISADEVPSGYKQLQALSEAQAQMRETDRIIAQINRLMEELLFDCMKVIGEEAYCKCMVDSAPVGIDSFLTIVGILTLPAEKLPNSITPEVAAGIIKGRDKCVASRKK